MDGIHRQFGVGFVLVGVAGSHNGQMLGQLGDAREIDRYVVGSWIIGNKVARIASLQSGWKINKIK